MSDQQVLIDLYQLHKGELRQIAKLEKEVNYYFQLKRYLGMPDRLSKTERERKNEEMANFKSSLEEIGFQNLKDNKKAKDEFRQLSSKLVNELLAAAKKIVPSKYNVDYCTQYDHYEPQYAQTIGPGYFHLSIHRDGSDKFCVSPYGYVFKNGEKFGRILKDGTIKIGRSGRFGNIVYD